MDTERRTQGDLDPVGVLPLRPELERLSYLDNLKVFMVAGVVAAHAIAGYAGMNWTYADVAEGEMGIVSKSLFGLLILPFAVFVMALFFLIAGMLTPGSLDRKGPRRFARDRLVRLGIPLAAFALVLWPLMTFLLYRAAGSDWSLWDVYGDAPTLDNGPLWFVEVLLIYSLGYAIWTGWRARPPRAASSDEPLRARHLVVLVAGIALGTFVVRRWFPFDSLQFSNLHVWQWPECLGLFGLGIVGTRRGWLRPVPERIRRGCGWTALAATVTLLLAFVSTEDPDVAVETYGGGWRWQALLLATVGGGLSVAGSIWLLALAQRHWGRAGRSLRAMSRAAYAAFMFQGIPLIVAALALRPFDVPLEFKALLVAALGIVGSFALGWQVVTRTRLRRIM